MKSHEAAGLMFNRDDVFFKVALARSLLLGQNDPFAKSVYFEHLFWWNHFFEREPKKRGSAEFYDSFASLCTSVAEHGFESRKSLIGISDDGRLAGGSHRLAAAIAKSELEHTELTTLPSTRSMDKQPDWNFSFFSGINVSKLALRQALLEKMCFFRDSTNIRILIVWPRAFRYLDQISQKISDFPGSSFVRVEVGLESEQGATNLIGLTYEGEKWAGHAYGLRKKAVEAGFDGRHRSVQLFIISAGAPESLSSLKDSIRQIWKGRFQGIHTTDGYRDTLAVLTTLASNCSISILNTMSTPKFLHALEMSREKRAELFDAGLNPLLCAFSGSGILEVLNVRRSGDIDFLSYTPEEVPAHWNNHWVYLSRYKINPHSVLTRPDHHIWFAGAKYLRPELYHSLAKNRGEPKDLLSLKLLDSRLTELQQSKASWKLVPVRNTLSEQKASPKMISPMRHWGPAETWSQRGNNPSPISDATERAWKLVSWVLRWASYRPMWAVHLFRYVFRRHTP